MGLNLLTIHSNVEHLKVGLRAVYDVRWCKGVLL